VNRRKLYQNLALQWDLLQAIPMPSSPERERKIRIGCLLLLLEAMRQCGEWREA
jgi:hypothetical protein